MRASPKNSFWGNPAGFLHGIVPGRRVERSIPMTIVLTLEVKKPVTGVPLLYCKLTHEGHTTNIIRRGSSKGRKLETVTE